MKFRTELKKVDSKEIITYSKRILCIGSCFAEHIHKRLEDLKFKSFINPCGIAYNPVSIASSIYYLLGQVGLSREDIFENNGLFAHFDFHSHFSALSANENYNNISSHLRKSRDFQEVDVVILSLGTAFAYFRKVNGEAVNNCHKVPNDAFTKRLLEVDEVVDVLQNAISELRLRNESLEVIVTVSPVRHLRDGMVENNLSKSTLLLAVSKLKEVTYFPSYELVLDDLRDYRFYAQDMVHPSREAISYILDFFLGQYFSEEEKNLRDKILAIQKDLGHRPLFPNSEQHKRFLENLLDRIKTLMAKYNVDFQDEVLKLSQKLDLK